MTMSRSTVPMGLIGPNGVRLPTDPLYWQYKGNKGGETYLKYVAYARIGTTVDKAGWMITENLQDASGNLMSRKFAQTGNNAIPLFDKIFDDSTAISISAVTKANPGQITTSAAHGLVDNDVVEIVGVEGMVELNSDIIVDAKGDGAIVFTVTKVDDTKFTIGVNTSAYTTYTSGGSIYKKTLFGLTYA